MMTNNRQAQRYREEYEERDTVVHRVTRSSPFTSFLRWVAFIIVASLLTAIGIFIFQNLALVVLVGNIIFWTAIVLTGVATLALVVVIVTWCVRKITEVQQIEPGEKGVWVRNIWGQMKVIHPVKEATVKQATDAVNGTTPTKSTMPGMTELLTDAIVPGMLEIVLGISVEVVKGAGEVFSKAMGLWEDLKTFAVYGFGRVGKTNTLMFYLIQAVFSGAKVYVNDHHVNKNTGLSNLLQPLSKWITFSTAPDDIVATFIEYNEELDRRMSMPPGTKFDTWFMATDEWNGLLEKISKANKKHIVGIAERLSREAAGYNLFGMFAIHELSENEIGSATLRRSFLGAVCHALDIGYAKDVFVNRKHQKMVPGLKKGEVLLRNADTREVQQLRIPKVTQKDILLAAEKMEDYEQEKALAQPKTSDMYDVPSPEYMDKLVHTAASATVPFTSRQLTEQRNTYGSRRFPDANQLPSQNYNGNGNETAWERDGTVGSQKVGTSATHGYQGASTPAVAPNGSKHTELTEEQIAQALRIVGKRVKAGEESSNIRKSLIGNRAGRALQETNEGIQFATQFDEDE